MDINADPTHYFRIKVAAHDARLREIQASKLAAPPLQVAGSIDMTGIYSDPGTAGQSARYGGSVAERAIDALKSLAANEIGAAKERFVRDLERAVGRDLSEGEGYDSLAVEEQMHLPQRLRDRATALRTVEHLAFEATGESGYSAGFDLRGYLPAHLIGYQSPDTVEQAAKLLIDWRVDSQMSAFRSMFAALKESGVVSVAARDALAAVEAMDADQLRGQLLSQQWSRYHQGQTELRWDEKAITYVSSMYNRFLDQ